MLDDADAEPEKLIDRAHPVGIAASEIIVDGDDVHAATFQRACVDGQRCDQRLAFAGLHLGDPAFVEHLATHDLDVEVAHADRAFAGLAHDREDFRQHRIERLALVKPVLELGGLGLQLGVGERRDLLSKALTARAVRRRRATSRSLPSTKLLRNAMGVGMLLRNDSYSGYGAGRSVHRRGLVAVRPRREDVDDTRPARRRIGHIG